MKKLFVYVDSALWSNSMAPEGIVERWLLADGAIVQANHSLTEIRIEDALHVIMAPASGRLTVEAQTGQVVEPGSLLATITVD